MSDSNRIICRSEPVGELIGRYWGEIRTLIKSEESMFARRLSVSFLRDANRPMAKADSGRRLLTRTNRIAERRRVRRSQRIHSIDDAKQVRLL